MNATFANLMPNTTARAVNATYHHRAVGFATPWHVCVHGLGLETATVAGPLAPLLRISALLVERAHDASFAAVVHELLQLLSHDARSVMASGGKGRAQPGALRITGLLSMIDAAEDRAVAAAAALHVLTHLGAGAAATDLMQSFLRSTLHDLLSPPAAESRQRYQALCAAAQLLHAAQHTAQHTVGTRAQVAVQLDWAQEQATRLGHTFHAKRIKAVLLGVQARGAGQWQPAHRLDQLDQLLLECLSVHGPLPPADAIHSGLDFVAFPLALALEAAAQVEPGRRLASVAEAVQTALYLLEQLSPASQVSQFAFLVESLLALDAVSVPGLQQRWAAVLRGYLDCSAATDDDAYLRSTYAIYAASRLGCLDLVPREVFTRIELALQVRARPASGYFSLPMVAAYALYTGGIAPAAQHLLPDPQALAELLASRLPPTALPADEVRKLSHALLYLGLSSQTARAERSHSRALREVAP